MASPLHTFVTIIVQRDNGHLPTSSSYFAPLSTVSSSAYTALPATTSRAIPGPGAANIEESYTTTTSGRPYTNKECGLIAGIVLSLVSLIVILVEIAVVYWRTQERRMGSKGRVPKIRWRSPRLRELELEEAKKKLRQFNVPSSQKV